MIRSHRKYLDPTAVLAALVDDFGNPIQIGDEKDVGEFNMILISRIEDGLKIGHSEDQDMDTFSLKRKDSLTPLQESRLLDEGIVTTFFYGKQIEELHFKENSGEDVDMVVNAIFGQVMLDVEEKDLYYAWDSACHSEIEEFITPQGHRTSAKQDVWLDRLPAILLVQVNRVKFDRATGRPVKLHSKFTYPKTLYPDRFLMKNKGLSSSLRQRELELKRKVKILETHLAQFEQYKDSAMPLEDVLKLTSAFFEDQLSSDYMQIDEESLVDVTTFNVAKIEPVTANLTARLRAGKELLEAYARTVAAKVAEMKTQLHAVTEEIDSIYRRSELQRHQYTLHSLLIHDGQAGSGHYYAYSYEAEEEKWWKFNDIHVTQVPESDVTRDSIGGHNFTSAYCLVYLDSRYMSAGSGLRLRTYSLSNLGTEVNDEYSAYLSLEQLRDVDEDNLKLMEEMNDWKLSGVIKHIQDLYTERSTAITTKFSESKTRPMETIKMEITNFAMYLKTKEEVELMRLVLLDLAVREADVEKRGLDQLPETDRLAVKLRTQFLHVCKDAPKTVAFNPSQRDKLKNLLEDFEVSYRHALFLEVAVRKFNEGDFLCSFQALDRGLAIPRNLINKTEQLLRDFSGLLIVRLCTLINQLLYDGSAELEIWVRHVGMAVAVLMQKESIHYRQAVHCLEHTRDLLPRVTAPEKAAALKLVFDEIVTNLLAVRVADSLDRAQLPAELQATVQEATAFTGYQWLEGWKNDQLAKKLQLATNDLRCKQNEIWLEMHNRMVGLKAMVSDTQRLEFEKKIGVFPKVK